MDVSSHFKVYIKTVSISSNKPMPLNNTFHAINVSQKKSTSFYIKIKASMNYITELHALLLKNHPIYVDYNKSYATKTDSEEIDYVTKNILNTNFQVIKELKEEISKNYFQSQNKEHKKIMVSIVEIHLKNIYKIYSELRFLHTKKKDFKSILKLNSFKKHDSILPMINYFSDQLDRNNHLSLQKLNNDTTNQYFNYEHKMLSSEDIQMFEAENEHIFSEFNIASDEIKQIENKVVEIHELQKTFMENVINQDKNLDNLLMTVVGSTQNVREANEQIRKAIQNNAGFRVWVLLFLLLMSFTLIFLDWYNP